MRRLLGLIGILAIIAISGIAYGGTDTHETNDGYVFPTGILSYSNESPPLFDIINDSKDPNKAPGELYFRLIKDDVAHTLVYSVKSTGGDIDLSDYSGCNFIIDLNDSMSGGHAGDPASIVPGADFSWYTGSQSSSSNLTHPGSNDYDIEILLTSSIIIEESWHTMATFTWSSTEPLVAYQNAIQIGTQVGTSYIMSANESRVAASPNPEPATIIAFLLSGLGVIAKKRFTKAAK